MELQRDRAETQGFVNDPPLDWFHIDWEPYIYPEDFEWSDLEEAYLFALAQHNETQSYRHRWFATLKP